MAKEVVITSVPRGIKLGRTGFQVVMRTAGTVDGVMTSLEQLAVYRHVPPQGSGRNPVIYSYRCVRGNAGVLNVLGRTLDAGNDFSNRSNKLAHLIVVDPAEAAALRGSSPAAVLATIESRLASVWEGGPEERATPVALPGPVVQAAVCRQWHAIKGDAGWGGLLAQRAMRGQASLVIAPDSTPKWCRTLLELFHEVLALLPPDNRWRTTFETTVVGTSSSLLRGTYAGSPESSAGHAGLLVVDLSQRAPLPANVATDEFITLAREGPRQVAGPRPPRIPGGPPTPASAGMDFDASIGSTSAAGPMIIGASGPPRAPVAWEDDDEPKSRMGWWILGGTLLLGLLLTGTVIGVWQWRMHNETRRLLQKIETYADIANGKDAATEATPALKEWEWVFREDPEAAQPREQDFPLLLSALRTKAVMPDHVRDLQARNHLVKTARAFADGNRGLNTVAALGADIASGVPEKHKQSVDQFVALWLTKAQAASLKDIPSLQVGIEAAKLIALAALDAENGEVRKRITLDHLRLMGMEGVPKDQEELVLVKVQNTLNKEAVSDWDKWQAALNSAIKTSQQDPNKTAGDPTIDENEKIRKEDLARRALRRKAYARLTDALNNYEKKPVESPAPITLAEGLDESLSSIELSLPSCGDWKPQASKMTPNDLQGNDAGGFGWILTGLPEEKDKAWGEITFSPKNKTLVFRPKLPASYLRDALYLPLKFSLNETAESNNSSTTPATAPFVIVSKEVVEASGSMDSLWEVVNGGTVQLTTTPPLLVNRSLLHSKAWSIRVSDPSGAKDAFLHLRPRDHGPHGMPITDIVSGTNAWLGSIASSPQSIARGDLAFNIVFVQQTSKPWADRTMLVNGSRKMLPPNDRYWSPDKFGDLMKLILDDDPAPPNNVVLTKDAIEKSFVKLLDVKPSDRKEGVLAWRSDVLYELLQPGHPYRTFIDKAIEANTGEKKPTLPKEPKRPDSDAKKEDMNAYEELYKRFLAKSAAAEAALAKWENDVRALGPTSLLLARFLEDPSCLDKDRQLTHIALGIETWLAVRDRQRDIQSAAENLHLSRAFSAEFDLTWQFDDGETVTVPRFRITPAKAVPPATAQPAAAPSPAPTPPPAPQSSEPAEPQTP